MCTLINTYRVLRERATCMATLRDKMIIFLHAITMRATRRILLLSSHTHFYRSNACEHGLDVLLRMMTSALHHKYSIHNTVQCSENIFR